LTLNALQGSFAIAYWVNFVVLIMQMLGMLSNPVVSLFWLLEQVDVHVMGSTPRASDARILGSFAINGGTVIGMYFLAY